VLVCGCSKMGGKIHCLAWYCAPTSSNCSGSIHAFTKVTTWLPVHLQSPHAPDNIIGDQSVDQMRIKPPPLEPNRTEPHEGVYEAGPPYSVADWERRAQPCLNWPPHTLSAINSWSGAKRI
jgi:hypothetical protein